MKKEKYLFLTIVILLLVTMNFFAQTLTVSKVNNSTYTGKVMFGYQGWFSHPDCPSPRALWWHWGNMSSVENKLSVEMYPDLREYGTEEQYGTAYKLPSGNVAPVFSSSNRNSVLRHMKWVRDYNTDGVFLQRFISEYRDQAVMKFRDQVTSSVKEGCEKYGRVFSIMYDGVGDVDAVANIKKDWMHLVDDLKITEKDSYLNHNGLPLVALWGYTLYGTATSAQLEDLIDWFHNNPIVKYRASIKLGVNDNWFNKSQDWLDAFAKVEVISPWAVGRYSNQNGYNNYVNNQISPSLSWCNSRGILYVPVVFPGFSWYNLKDETRPQNEIPRNGGNFYWLQSYGAINAGAKSIYIAMLDEVDESTAMFKTAENESQSPAQKYWLNLDADGYTLPSDWYLRCAGKTAAVLRGNQSNSSILGTPALGIMTIRYTGNCGVEFIFPDFSGQTKIEISLDGGTTFPYSTLDNTGKYTINNLSGIYNVFVRHPGLNAVPMGEIKLAGNCSLGINENAMNLPKINLFPQPAKDIVYINGIEDKTISCQIFNALGQKVLSCKANNNKLDVSNLKKGVYVLIIKGYTPVKFMKE